MAVRIRDLTDSGNLDPLIVQWFERWRAPLIEFAEKYGLDIETYHWDSPSWYFVFRPPEGGVGRIDYWLERMSGDESRFIVIGGWHRDDYERDKRFSRHERGKPIAVDRAAIGAELERMLSVVLHWPLESLRNGDEAFREPRHSERTRERLENLTRRYALPKLLPPAPS